MVRGRRGRCRRIFRNIKKGISHTKKEMMVEKEEEQQKLLSGKLIIPFLVRLMFYIVSLDLSPPPRPQFFLYSL
jgi:hypothetical protein